MMLTEPKRERILALDLLRGYFLVVILIDHLGFFPGPLELLTGRGTLWASAAEGFFLISGLLVGYVYAPRLVRGFWAVAKKLWRRAAMLYVGAVGLTWLFTFWGQFVTPAYVSSGVWTQPPIGEYLYETVTLQYVYGWADFLQYYAVFMVLAPLALWLCSRSYAWVLLAASLVVWWVGGAGYFTAWQLLFMIGICVGYYLPRLQRWFGGLRAVKRRRIIATFVAATIATMAFSALASRLSVYFVETYGGFTTLPQWFQSVVRWLYDVRNDLRPLVNKEALGPLRLAAALLWFTGFYFVFRRYEAVIERQTRGVLRVFGQNSLLVYITQSFVVFAALAYLGKDHSMVVGTFLTLLGLALVYVVARYRIPLQRALHKVTGRPSVLAALIIVNSVAVLVSWSGQEPLARDSGTQPVTAITPIVVGEVKRDIEYCDGQLLDYYQPRVTASERSPVVLYIHGGGWVMNDKASETDQLALIDNLRDSGFAVASINYRKVPDGYYPTAVENALCAVRFLRAQADTYAVDSDNIMVYGFSAGGYLAASVGTLPDNSVHETAEYAGYSSRVNAVISLAGLFDFTDGLNIGNQERIDRFLNGADPLEAEITTHVTPDDPPFLLIHGMADQYVPLDQDYGLMQVLEQHGVPYEQVLVTDADHGLNPMGGQPEPDRQTVQRQMAEFIQKHVQ